jgi:hypothetical protein
LSYICNNPDCRNCSPRSCCLRYQSKQPLKRTKTRVIATTAQNNVFITFRIPSPFSLALNAKHSVSAFLESMLCKHIIFN